MPATACDGASPLIFRRDPIAQTAKAIRPVDRMASDGACHDAVQPNTEVGPETVIELRGRPREEQPDVVRRKCPIHPRKPLPQVLAILLDGGEQRLGIPPFELSEFEPVGYRAPEHFRLPIKINF